MCPFLPPDAGCCGHTFDCGIGHLVTELRTPTAEAEREVLAQRWQVVQGMGAFASRMGMLAAWPGDSAVSLGPSVLVFYLMLVTCLTERGVSRVLLLDLHS